MQVASGASVSYFILYRGQSADQQRFLRHYRNVHCPILNRFPGIAAVRLHCPVNQQDGQVVADGAFALIAQLEFSDLAALDNALQSPERVEARADMVTNFPSFTGVVWHQATQSERIRPTHG